MKKQNKKPEDRRSQVTEKVDIGKKRNPFIDLDLQVAINFRRRRKQNEKQAKLLFNEVAESFGINVAEQKKKIDFTFECYLVMRRSRNLTEISEYALLLRKWLHAAKNELYSSKSELEFYNEFIELLNQRGILDIDLR